MNAGLYNEKRENQDVHESHQNTVYAYSISFGGLGSIGDGREGL